MEKQCENIEHRLIVFEEKLEYQDYTLEKLNDVIISQQHQIDKLESALRRLTEKVEAGYLELDESGEEPPPPHY